MPIWTADPLSQRKPACNFVLHFTPAEWRTLLEDDGFLRQPDNSFSPPRRLMGVRVEIVPDHRFG